MYIHERRQAPRTWAPYAAARKEYTAPTSTGQYSKPPPYNRRLIRMLRRCAEIALAMMRSPSVGHTYGYSFTGR